MSTQPPGNQSAPAHLVAGAAAEERAARYLVTHGLALRERNFRVRQGELDLIMDDGDVLVFVEVRFRRAKAKVSPTESITPTKQRRLVAAAEAYRARHPRIRHRRCRFDVIAITGEGDDNIRWVRGAFDA